MSRQTQRHPHPLASLLAVVAGIAFVLAPLAALAQQPAEKPKGPKPKVFLLPTTGAGDISSIIPERVGEMLRKQVGDSGQVDLLPTYKEIAEQYAAGGGSANAAVAEAERQYTSGIGLLTAGENEKASKAFQRAVDIMEQNVADLHNFDILADAYKNLAAAYYKAGFDFDARKKMKQYAYLRPNDTLDPEKFDEELIEVYADEAKKVKKGGPGKLTVETSGGGEAMVYIDGVEKGATPVTVEDVGFGHHFLVVRGAGGDVWAEKIRVKGRGKEQTFTAELAGGGEAVAGQPAGDEAADEDGLPAFYTELRAALASGRFTNKGLQPYLSELATRTGAEFIAWSVMLKEDGQYRAVPFVWRASDGLLVQTDPVDFNLELSNLRVGVTTLAAFLLAAIGQMPEDDAVTDVALLAPPPAPQAASEAGEAPEGPVAQQDAEAERSPYVAESDDQQLDDPGVVVPSEEEGMGMWAWVGIGAGGLVAAGLIGGFILMSADEGGPSSSNFDAEVTW